MNTLLTPQQFKKSLALSIQQAKLDYATDVVKEVLGDEFCVCWLTHDKPV